LDGSFTFTGVTPGNYYVIAQLAGYLSPELEFTPSDWSHPTEEAVQRMAQVLTPVTVLANYSSRVDISLIKGGLISGTVHYEDGMPLSNSEVDLLRHDPKGKVNDYYPVLMAAGTAHTDDQGGYRIAGLPEGEYKLYAKLRVNEPPPDPAWFQGRVVSVNDLIAASSQWSELTIYFDHGFRQADSRSVKLGSGEASGGDDIEIRLSKLHSISGTVLDAETGNAVNSATVRMLWIADDPDSSPTQIDVMNVGEDGSFHFGLVPEGAYKLTVTRAKAVMHQPALVPPPPNANGYMQPVQDTAPVDKTSREYSDASQSLTVTNDMSGVTVKLIAKPVAAAAQ